MDNFLLYQTANYQLLSNTQVISYMLERSHKYLYQLICLIQRKILTVQQACNFPFQFVQQAMSVFKLPCPKYLIKNRCQLKIGLIVVWQFLAQNVQTILLSKWQQNLINVINIEKLVSELGLAHEVKEYVKINNLQVYLLSYEIIYSLV